MHNKNLEEETVRELRSILEALGCFANRDINKGELFTFNVILVNKFSSVYLFPWRREISSIVLSEITYSNSSIEPNMKILSIDRIKLTKTFIAIKNIAQNEEITLDY